MKKVIPLLMLTVTASVVGQSKEQLMQAVVNAVGANDKNGIYVEGEMVGGGIVNNADKPLYTFIAHVPGKKGEKDAQAKVDAMIKSASAQLADRQEQIFLKVVMTETGLKRVPTGETGYYSQPLHITSWCNGGICSSTVYGGNVVTYDRMKLARYSHELAYAVWRNY